MSRLLGLALLALRQIAPAAARWAIRQTIGVRGQCEHWSTHVAAHGRWGRRCALWRDHPGLHQTDTGRAL